MLALLAFRGIAMIGGVLVMLAIIVGVVVGVTLLIVQSTRKKPSTTPPLQPPKIEAGGIVSTMQPSIMNATVNTDSKKAVLNPFVLVAGCCAAASFSIAAIFLTLLLYTQFSNAGVWAVAAMVAAPAAMGVGVAYFMSKQTRQ